ncbi:RNA 2',3'-cyclic phosphodiesterase [Psychrobacillus sp. FJAT-51614]|uniref:RNA 2',3'-cyclic phosphodiesterase n=1 Tax=Psychrobacillus mangrovi TaxID=3117745 RepID=A0ABU8F5B5_9BACI
MNTHYFIGIKIPPTLATSIIEERNKTNLHETYKTLPFKEDLHITLFYTGAMESKKMDQIIQSLQKIDWSSFDLTTNGHAHFGSNRTPRVVYTALEESNSLKLLQQQVVNTLTDSINTDHTKDFNAHITIAKKFASNGLLSIEDFHLPKTTFEVSSFSVFRINPNSKPRYEEIASIRCKGG